MELGYIKEYEEPGTIANLHTLAENYATAEIEDNLIDNPAALEEFGEKLSEITNSNLIYNFILPKIISPEAIANLDPTQYPDLSELKSNQEKGIEDQM